MQSPKETAKGNVSLHSTTNIQTVNQDVDEMPHDPYNVSHQSSSFASMQLASRQQTRQMTVFGWAEMVLTLQYHHDSSFLTFFLLSGGSTILHVYPTRTLQPVSLYSVSKPAYCHQHFAQQLLGSCADTADRCNASKFFCLVTDVIKLFFRSLLHRHCCRAV